MRLALRHRLVRRVAVPAAVVVAAVSLGMLVWWPASTPTPTLAGTVLTASVTKSTNHKPNLNLGKTLFDETCASCHGSAAQGSAVAPSLQGLGAGTIDLWLSSGWMPLATPSVQPARKPPKYDPAQNVDIAQYVASLSNYQGFAIPKVNLKGANVANGFSVFAEICAACHTITGAGDALSGGIIAPSLHDVSKTQIAEAVRTGPGNMPRFGRGVISNAQLSDVIAYVTRNIEHPTNPGGLGLGGVGPVAEGFVGLFIGVGLCVLAAFWIGDRTPRGPVGAEQHGDGEGGPGGDGGNPGPVGDDGGSDREIQHV